MTTITISQTDTDENILLLANSIGYSSTIKEEQEVEMTMEEIMKNAISTVWKPYIKEEGWDEYCIAITYIDIPNPVSPAEFTWAFYQQMVKDNIANRFKIIEKAELMETRRLEDEAINKWVEEAVWGGSEIVIK